MDGYQRGNKFTQSRFEEGKQVLKGEETTLLSSHEKLAKGGGKEGGICQGGDTDKKVVF